MFLTRAIYVSRPTVSMGVDERDAVMVDVSAAGLRNNPRRGIGGLLERLEHIRRYGVVAPQPIPGAA